MKNVFILKGVYFESETEAGTEQRALEVLAAVQPILECQKHYWSGKIKELFEEYVGGGDIADILDRTQDGLFWDFHKALLVGMCEAYEAPL